MTVLAHPPLLLITADTERGPELVRRLRQAGVAEADQLAVTDAATALSDLTAAADSGSPETRDPPVVIVDAALPDQGAALLCAELRRRPAGLDLSLLMLTHAETPAALVDAWLLAGGGDIIEPVSAAPAAPAGLRARIAGARRLGREIIRRRVRETSLAATVTAVAAVPLAGHFDPPTGLADQGLLVSDLMCRPVGALIAVRVDAWPGYVRLHGPEIAQTTLVRIADAIRGAEGHLGDLAALIEPGTIVIHVPADALALPMANQLARRVSWLAIPHGASPIGPIVTLSVGIVSAIGNPLLQIRSALKALQLPGTLTDQRPTPPA